VSRTRRRQIVGRFAGERGTSMVAALVLLFTFTAGAIIWLGRDVSQSVALRSTAQSIAFQAARAGAQEVVVTGLRDGSDPTVALDPEAAEHTARRRANEMFSAYAVVGVVVDVLVDADDNITVSVRLDGPAGRNATGVGTAHPESR
jgi:hypothetical protein